MPYPEWLPDLIELNSYKGNWDSYLEHLYSVYTQNFITSKPIYNGTPVGVKGTPKSMTKMLHFGILSLKE